MVAKQKSQMYVIHKSEFQSVERSLYHEALKVVLGLTRSSVCIKLLMFYAFSKNAVCKVIGMSIHLYVLSELESTIVMMGHWGHTFKQLG